MDSPGPIVAKVGGSLYAWPELGMALGAWLTSVHADDVLLVPGGGAIADAIRDLDRIHRLGEEASHWLAIQALSVNALFLQRLLPQARLVADLPERGVSILDPYPFFQADERRPDHLPHSWQVTSDALAMRAATLMGARELILLKSIAWSDGDWSAASRAGIVDGIFPVAVQQAPTMPISVVNLRAWK